MRSAPPRLGDNTSSSNLRSSHFASPSSVAAHGRSTCGCQRTNVTNPTMQAITKMKIWTKPHCGKPQMIGASVPGRPYQGMLTNTRTSKKAIMRLLGSLMEAMCALMLARFKFIGTAGMTPSKPASAVVVFASSPLPDVAAIVRLSSPGAMKIAATTTAKFTNTETFTNGTYESIGYCASTSTTSASRPAAKPKNIGCSLMSKKRPRP
mmetsp:Transcript_87229/g.281780  ORF Transcript_87229/g.281780 Transcript_87229/m.281780 type:complete len:208 (+) Transcript_87229:187-810(+)